VPFDVTSVAYIERGTTVNVLRTRVVAHRVKVTNGGLTFPKIWIGRDFEVTLKNSIGHAFKAKVPILSCNQRTSLQYGERDTGADVSATRITGRITGCPLSGDWWIRAMPMFGGNEFKPSFEGRIFAADGSFLMEASFRGERHIVVIGKNKDPVKAFGMSLTAGGLNDAGVVDLRGTCPP
jgi:hypothetical protein